MSTAEKACTCYDYFESRRGARFEVPLAGWSLPVDGILANAQG